MRARCGPPTSEERAVEQHSALQAAIAAPAVQCPRVDHVGVSRAEQPARVRALADQCEPLCPVEASVRLRRVRAWDDVGRSHVGLHVLQCDERDDERGALAVAVGEVGMQRLRSRARVRDERRELIQSAVGGREAGGWVGCICASKIWCLLVAASGGVALGVAAHGGALFARCGVLSIGAECSRDERLDRLEELGECVAYGRREVQLEVVPGEG